MDGAPAGPLQQRLRQHPVPRAAAVLQVAGRRGRSCPTRWRGCRRRGPGAGSPGLHLRGTSDLERACRGGTFAQRRDTAIIAVFTATGIRLSEMAGIRHDPDDPARNDLDLDRREISVAGKGGKDRIVKIGHQAARALDRYLRARSRHPQAWRDRAVAGREQPRAADRHRHLPDDRPPRPAGRRARHTRTGSGTISATPGSTAAGPKQT